MATTAESDRADGRKETKAETRQTFALRRDKNSPLVCSRPLPSPSTRARTHVTLSSSSKRSRFVWRCT